MRFVLIDETLVSYGYWVNVSGIDLTLFKKNPIMLWMHKRASRWDTTDNVAPIGRWEDIKVEEIKGIKSITADAVFDEKDEFAIKIKNKIEGGFLKMASAGLKVKTWSEDKKYLKPGQTRSTVVKSELYEASIVDIGANKNAIALYDDEGIVNLSDNNDTNFIPLLNSNKSKFNMKVIALKLGLNEDATEVEVLAEIDKLRNSESKSKEIVKKLNADRVEKLMEHKSITDENKEQFKELAETNFGLAEKTLSIMGSKEQKEKSKQDTERLSDVIKKTNSSKTVDEAKTWEDFSDKELAELRDNKREDYIALYEDEFGSAPVIED